MDDGKKEVGIPQHANECPEDMYLNKYVRGKVCGACANSPDIWRDLGIQLMGQQSAAKLDEMKVNKGGNVRLCCSAMFDLWRQKQPKANWSQLIIALKDIELDTLADDIKKLLLPSVEQQHNEHVQNDQNMQHLDTGIKSKATKKIMQSPELSVALSCACRSVSDAWGLRRLDGMNLDGMNLDGTGTIIAILDTAIYQDFPSFTGKEISCINFLPDVPVASTVHGTICSAVAVGLQSDTTPRGVAPCAQLIVYRIAEGCYASIVAILAALQDIQNKLERGIQIDVVSISYDCDENNEDAIRNKIEELTKKGITFVAAAGNRGQYQARACIPARFDNVISVGALGKHGLKTDFTPPDVYAPGEDFEFPSIEDKFSGTSYATPAVAGLVLLLRQWANHVGSPAKENINHVEILRRIFRKEMQVKSEDGSIDIFDPVGFFVRMQGNPPMLNDIVQKYLDEENKMEQ